MKKKTRHVLGISGGKDSAALAIYMKTKYPAIDLEFYSCDTGKELEETYQLIKNLEVYLGIKINLLLATKDTSEADPFDHFLKLHGGYLPSATARWCTKTLKLDPFEKYVGNDPVVSYVGIRGDEEREGYISTKKNIQSIFPFRKNIWSEDVVSKVLSNQNLEKIIPISSNIDWGKNKEKIETLISRKVDPSFTLKHKLNAILDSNIKGFNHLVFQFLKTTDYPLAAESDFALLDNEDVLIKSDIFKILEESGVGVPEYYKKIKFEVNGKMGEYARSRSGCYFCFYQQKIEWVWLYEQHPELFLKALEYEKTGYSWSEEALGDLIKPERIMQIKEDYIKKTEKNAQKKSSLLMDILEDDDTGCASCFI